MRPSLVKHTGCDIIDINPGVGIWSSTIHDLLKPRKHYLMEPDHELYTPLLQPLLDEEGSTYKLIPKSGALWGQLNNLLSPAHLPQQVELGAGDSRLDSPNDTLLVLANLGWYPRRPFRAFPSVSLLVIHQLLSAVRAHSLFHRYGLVRMLVWLSNDEGKQVLPRNISARRKMAVEAEVSCTGIYEIASSTVESAAWKRDESINVESSRKVLKKMEEAGITTPEGREGEYQRQAVNGLYGQDHEDDRMAVRRKWQDELHELQEQHAAGSFSEFVDVNDDGTQEVSEMDSRLVLNPEWKRLCDLRSWYDARTKKGTQPIKGKRLGNLKILEAQLVAGDIKQYLDIAPNTQVGEVEDADAESSEQTKEVLKLKRKGVTGGERQEVRTRRPRGTKRTEKYERMRYLEARIKAEHKIIERAVPLFAEFEAILALQKKSQTLEGQEAEGLQLEIDERMAEFGEGVDSLGKNAETFRHRLDNRRAFDNNPPILYWDRREAEPLQVRPNEFHPEHELCLLDFHPAPLWPVLRQDFPATYDIFEYILSTIFMTSTQSVKSALTAVAPGAFEWLLKECPSLTDMSKGGNPDLDFLTVRCLTLEMFKEIMEAWMRWPFRPDRFELIKKSGSIAYDPDEEALE